MNMSVTPTASRDHGIDDGTHSSVANVDDPSQAKPGDRVGRYELRERLGAGGMGVVYAAWDPQLDRRVAIKFVRRGHAVSAELLRRRLKREAQAMARLRHPNVVAVHDLSEVDGQLFVAMEYVDGVSLRKWLQVKSRSVAEILAVFRGAGEGLVAAHAEGVIHRDFKPDNVLVTHDGKALVLDFGLASWTTTPGSDPGRTHESSDELLGEADEPSPGSRDGSGESDPNDLTRPGAVLGTLNYMAPEQRRGRSFDARVDQYAFCVALWQALSGELPYGRGGSSRSLARARVGRLGKLRKDVPAKVERALRRGLAWHPDERWPSMRALLDALAPTNYRRWWWAAIPTALGVAAIVLAAGERDSATVHTCESGRVSAVWNDAVSEQLAVALARRGELARRSWPYVEEQLAGWAASWTAVDLELCDRYGRGITPALHERQLLCLDRQLEHFEIATELLGGATAEELEHSFDMLARLPDPSACRDASIEPAHPDVSPQELAQLERGIERVELEYELGRLAQADHASAELFTATLGRGFEALHVRIAEQRGVVLAELERREEAVDVAFSGLAAAERDGAAALRLHAFTSLVYVHVATQDLQGAKRWLAQAHAIADHHELDRELLRELASNEAWVKAVDGRLDEAIAGYDHALALTDRQTDPLQHGQLIISRAQLFGYLGQPQQALEQFVIGERELVQVMGPEHPEMLDVRNAKAVLQLRLEQWQPARVEMLAIADSLEALRGQPTAIAVGARAHAAWALGKLGDCAGARAEFEPLIPLAREHMVYPSPDLGKLLTERAQLCDYGTDESVAFAREALALYLEAVGDQHVMIAGAREVLARAHYQRGELKPAGEEIAAALAIYAAVAPIGAEKVPEAEALAELIRHARLERE
ncbi:MAG TPA: serine/threonine-protein kinase [Enhygromyxa sp.]|nr:serine/threonine-protein kinase [Enhygromyxa sp.]